MCVNNDLSFCSSPLVSVFRAWQGGLVELWDVEVAFGEPFCHLTAQCPKCQTPPYPPSHSHRPAALQGSRTQAWNLVIAEAAQGLDTVSAPHCPSALSG